MFGLTMWSISLSMSSCSPSVYGQGHATHFYILESEIFAAASHHCIVSLWITPTTVECVVSECTILLYVGRL